MPIVYESEFPNLESIFISDPEPRIMEWQGHNALRLSGEGACLVVFPEVNLTRGSIEVDIGSEGPAFPGIAFRILDSLNYELGYAQPHTSGKWDALQYDPVFHGSNTWQLYHGPGAHQSVEVPTNEWFRFRIEFQDQSACIQVGDQEPLVVNHLAHTHQSGLVGLWTYLPAYFSNLCIRDETSELLIRSKMISNVDVGTVTEWFLQGFGVVDTEPNGILNLNRYLPTTTKEVILKQRIELFEDQELTFNLGYSDVLSFQIGGEIIYQGENLFHDSPKWEERGYVSPDQQVIYSLSKGIHTITATLTAKEFFGFGLTLRIDGEKYSLLPAQLFE